MLKIAVADTPSACDRIKAILLDLQAPLDEKIIVEPYYTGEHICDAIGKHPEYDLIFLSTELRGIDGLRVAHYIRSDMGDELQQIVFTSSKKHHSYSAHAFHPLDFLITPINSYKLEELLRKHLKMQGELDDTFKYTSSHAAPSVKINDIRYLTVSNRLVYIIMKKGQHIEYYGSLRKAYNEQLRKNGFLFAHKQFVVNPLYIERYEYNRVILKDGTEIPIGSSHRREICEYRKEKQLAR